MGIFIFTVVLMLVAGCCFAVLVAPNDTIVGLDDRKNCCKHCPKE